MAATGRVWAAIAEHCGDHCGRIAWRHRVSLTSRARNMVTCGRRPDGAAGGR